MYFTWAWHDSIDRLSMIRVNSNRSRSASASGFKSPKGAATRWRLQSSVVSDKPGFGRAFFFNTFVKTRTEGPQRGLPQAKFFDVGRGITTGLFPPSPLDASTKRRPMPDSKIRSVTSISPPDPPLRRSSPLGFRSRNYTPKCRFVLKWRIVFLCHHSEG